MMPNKQSVSVVLIIFALFFLFSCGIYTFNGSTLPAHLKTVDVPLFTNECLQPGVAEEITASLTERVRSMNLLRLVTNTGDATITGRVMSYSNYPHTFSRESIEKVDITEYGVRITVEVIFMDNRKNEPIYKGTIVGEGYYDFKAGREEQGRQKAETNIVDQIMQNSVQSW
jgi:hypothetical protein